MRIVHGEGSLIKKEGCWMSWAAWFAGQEDWTDNAECVDRYIRHLCIWVNDSLLTDRDRERVIGPILAEPMGTRTDDKNVTTARFCRAVGFLMEQLAKVIRSSSPRHADELLMFGGVCPEDKWPEAMAAIEETKSDMLRLRRLVGRMYSGEVYLGEGRRTVINRSLDSSRAVMEMLIDNFSLNTSHFVGLALEANDLGDFDVAEHVIVPLILELCAIGTKQEVPQVRTVEELVDA